MKRYKQLDDMVRFIRPRTIVEIGTNKGASAERMCREALKYRDKVHYIGYDLFEDATAEISRAEGNGKGAASEAAVRERLSKIDGLTFELVKGNTRTTLHGTDVVADLAFIDGGHSIETIMGDYEAVKGSNVVVFDDYYAEGANTSKVGCNRIVSRLPHELLPIKDNSNGLVIQLAVVGYSSAWLPAFERIRKKDGFDSTAIWREDFKRRVDVLAAIGTLEGLLDPSETLESMRAMCRKLFFVLKADGVRSLDWWRAELEKRFQVNEWFGGIEEINGPTTEVVGTATPLFMVGEFNARGVMGEDERFDHTVENCPKVKKRLQHIPEPHDRTALIVCYGPSLNDTWTDIAGHIKFKGGDVFSVSGAHDFLLRRDIVPDYQVECDPRAHKADNLTRLGPGKTEYLIASCCHPKLVDKLLDRGCDVTLWHMCNGQESFRTVDEIEPDQFMVHGGGNAGLRAIAVAYVMGYRDFVIYGMDCSFKGNKQWAGPHVGKFKDVIEVVCDGEHFLTSAVNVTYARQFASTMENAVGASFTLVGEGLLQSMMRASNKLQEKAA